MIRRPPSSTRTYTPFPYSTLFRSFGPVVEDVSRDFDRYWASESAYPAARILPEVSLEELKQLSRQASLVETDPAARAYVEAIRSLPFIEQTLAGTIPLEWAPVHMVSDDPAKGVGKAPQIGRVHV